jgi:DNA helicase HerA-like ATPase
MINAPYIVPKHKNKRQDLLEQPHVTLILGQTGSGKSTAMINYVNALDEKKNYKDAMFVSTNMVDPIVKAFNENVIKTDKPDELDDFMFYISQRGKEMKPDQIPNTLLILDDVVGSPEFKQLNARSSFANFVINHRHYKTDIILTSQAWKNSFSPLVKKQARRLFIFPPREAKEETDLRDTLDKDKLHKALTFVRQHAKTEGNEHSFLNVARHPAETEWWVNFSDRKIDI